MNRLFTGLLLSLTCMTGFSQAGLDYFLPEDEYLPGIPESREVIGHQVGEWHLTHDKLTWYLTELAGASDRVVMREYARSYENRPLFHLMITSPENHARLEEIRQEHLKLSDPAISSTLDIDDMPVVVTLGYGVHGNESSASNASVLVAYYLAASLSEEVESYLEHTVILLDPCLNPDGFNRHASWINMHKSMVPMRDDHSRGFREPWPGGRTNHYWFDLNRDWILLQHPESRGRVKVFHEWKPNVQTDHHEMGSSSSFFFQPGVPSRINPLTPLSTTELTRKIARYHAGALDGIGSLYFTEERFDDFYYGKGSSYPDVNGGIGILFEQAGTRGYERETPRGMLTFPYAIRNQVKVSLSSIRASFELRKELLEHQRTFYRESSKLYAGSEGKGYVFGGNDDPSALSAMLDILLQHRVEVYRLTGPHRSGESTYDPESSYLVPLDQPRIRLVKSLFQPITSFTDSLFYDVSTWTFPYAFNIPFDAVGSTGALRSLKGAAVHGAPPHAGSLEEGPAGTGYIFSWNDYNAPRALYAIQDKGLFVQAATGPILVGDGGNHRSFGYGSFFIPVEKQSVGGERTREILGSGEEALSRWLKEGGTIVAIHSANQWLADHKLADLSFKKLKLDTTGVKRYRDLAQEQGAQRITGSIFEAKIDTTHPVGFGITRSTIPLFRNSTLIAEPVYRPYAVPVRYGADPLLSGYVPSRIYEELKNSPAVVISVRGRGRVISFVDNPNFRGFWYGTQRLFMNAICFGPVISPGSAR